MRKLTGAVFQSLDGVMQAPGGPDEDPSGGFRFGGWSTGFWDESLHGPVGKLFDGEFDLLLGRRTYDIFAAHWPYNLEDPIGAKFQRINKYVLTHSSQPLGWEGSHKLSGDTAEAVTELKRSNGRNLLIQGSSTIYPPLLAAGLVDRLILMTFPVMLGEGKRIFDGSEKPGALSLVDHFVSDKGVVFATYEPAGEVPIGSFAMAEPSEAELERREKMAEGGLVRLALYGHPFSSYTWKVLIPLYANGTEFAFRELGPDKAEHNEFVQRAHPAGKFPVLVDGGTTIVEATAIVEYLAERYPGEAPLIPGDAVTARMLDRVFDNYVMGNLQRVVGAYIANAKDPDPAEVESGKAGLRRAYGWLEHWLPENPLPPHVSLVTCAAAPSLFYADWIERIPADCPRLAALRAELLALPAVARCVDQARPYRALFPLGAPDRD